jgi:hypothetical protein
MISRLRQHVTFANVGVIVALVLAGSGFAVAAIPGPGGVIQGCLDKRTGTLRVIDARKHCTRRERAIRWNQQGRPGATGATGAAGAQGPRGSDAQFNGAAAGGDLTGSYPSPTVRPGAITGAGVAADSLTGAHIVESTLGQVPDAAKLGGLPPGSFSRTQTGSAFGAVPSAATFPVATGLTVSVHCLSSPATGNQVSLNNNTGRNVEVFIDDGRGLTTTPYVRALATGGSASTDVDTATGAIRRVIINAGFPSVTAVVTVVRETASPAGCYAMVHGLT